VTTSDLGPVEIVAIAFPAEHIPASVQQAVRDVVGSGVVTLLDLAVIRRDDAGAVEFVELSEIDGGAVLTDNDLAGQGLAGEDDLREIADGMAPGTSVLVLVVEHTWTRGVLGATRAAGGMVMLNERIPAEVAREVADLALT
jgi:uncharacterized membrane protein